MGKIVLNDETEVSGGMISKNNEKRILVSIPGDDIVQAAILFGDPNKTQKMIYTFGIYKYEYTGYVNMDSLSIDKISNETHIYLSGENASSKHSYTVSETYAPKPLEEVNNE